MLYMPRHFTIKELVPEHVFDDRGEKAWELLDPLLLESIDLVRDKFGPAIINNWASGGHRHRSGLRTEQTEREAEERGGKRGAKYSQHLLGRAVDILLIDADVEESRQYILSNPHEFPLITGIELNKTWLHIDTRNTKGVKTFYG